MTKSNRVSDIDKSKKERWIVRFSVLAFFLVMVYLMLPEYIK